MHLCMSECLKCSQHDQDVLGQELFSTLSYVLVHPEITFSKLT